MDDEIRKDIDIFLNTPEIKEKILECLSKTNRIGNEHMFHWAIDNNKIITSEIVEGEPSGIDTQTGIAWMKFFQFKKHGDFHTHPTARKIILPSNADIYQWILNQNYFSCIGGFIEGKTEIKCFPIKIIKESINDIKEYLRNIDDLSEITNDTERLIAEFNNAVTELRESMRHRPDMWESDIVVKEYT